MRKLQALCLCNQWKPVVPALVAGVTFNLCLLGCGDGGDHHYTDPCAGPVPCGTEDWGTTYYEFVDQWGYPVIIVSDGITAGGGAFVLWEGISLCPIVVVGPVVDCHNAELTYAEVDLSYPWDFVPDYWTEDVQGNVNVCGTTLRTSGVVIDGYAYPDIVATYVGSHVLDIEVMVEKGVEPPAMLMRELMRRLDTEQ